MAYITVAELKTYLNITVADDDTILSDMIDNAQAFIEQYTGTVFEVASDTTKTFDAIEDVDGPYLYFDGLIASITTVTNGDSDSTVITDYVTEPRNVAPYFAIKIKDNSSNSWTYSTTPEDAISITGRWGYSATPPGDIKQAMLRLSSYFYKQKDSGLFEVTGFTEGGAIEIPMGIPKVVLQILDKYRRNYRIY